MRAAEWTAIRRSFGPGLGFGTFLIANLDSLFLEVTRGIWVERKDERVIHLPRLSWLAVYGLDCYCFGHCKFKCRLEIARKKSFNPECGLGIETLWWLLDNLMTLKQSGGTPRFLLPRLARNFRTAIHSSFPHAIKTMDATMR